MIHFSHQVNKEERIACMPNIKEFKKSKGTNSRSTDYRAVTCPACMKTRSYLDASKKK